MNKKKVVLITSGIALVAVASYVIFLVRRNMKYKKVQEGSFDIYIEK